MRIGIIEFPGIRKEDANITPLSNLLQIITHISNDVHVVLGKNSYEHHKHNSVPIFHPISNEKSTNKCHRIINYMFIQFKISYEILKLRKQIDVWIFFIGGDTLVLPMFTAKALKTKVILAFTGSSIETLKYSNDKFYKYAQILSKINCILTDRILLYSVSLITEWHLEEFSEKISIAPRHFLDMEKFSITKDFCERRNIVGYIGRLSKEKGILNFVEALTKLIKIDPNFEFLIGGDGELFNELEIYIRKNKLDEHVTLEGWISHDNLPMYLNELKLLVLPSFTEGLPNIMLETIACGTPILASSVGAIPDFIIDGKTGFLMENNSPECISKNIHRVLNHPNLEITIYNARKLIEKDFSYESSVQRFKKIIEKMVW